MVDVTKAAWCLKWFSWPSLLGCAVGVWDTTMVTIIIRQVISPTTTVSNQFLTDGWNHRPNVPLCAWMTHKATDTCAIAPLWYHLAPLQVLHMSQAMVSPMAIWYVKPSTYLHMSQNLGNRVNSSWRKEAVSIFRSAPSPLINYTCHRIE